MHLKKIKISFCLRIQIIVKFKKPKHSMINEKCFLEHFMAIKFFISCLSVYMTCFTMIIKVTLLKFIFNNLDF